MSGRRRRWPRCSGETEQSGCCIYCECSLTLLHQPLDHHFNELGDGVGEAKRKLAEARTSFLAELEKWSFQPTEWEARTVAEISQLPVVKVTRYPDEHLADMRMLARECHANARFMQDNDPDKCLRQVTGWWPQDGQYVLHSVVDQYGQYVCVTPAPMYVGRTFDFIPDEKIEWRDEGDYRTAYRDGIEIGPGVRADPAKTLAELEGMRQRLLSGMNPYQAVKR